MTQAVNKNLQVWDQACITDRAHTKQFTRGGGFSGTAINQTYLIRKATEMWGAMGGAWGVEIIEQGLMQGQPLTVEDYSEEYATTADGVVVVTKKETTTRVIGHEQIHFVRVKLHYPSGDSVGVVEHFGQTTFVGQNKRGPFTDEEAPKKSLTDAIGKALSMLGFSADVYLGTFDDNKYVNDKKAADDKVVVKADITPKMTMADLTAAKEKLSECKSVDELRTLFSSMSKPLQDATKEFSTALASNLK